MDTQTSMKPMPRAGERLRISDDSDDQLCTPGEVVTVVKVELLDRGGAYIHIDGRREIRRFFWGPG